MWKRRHRIHTGNKRGVVSKFFGIVESIPLSLIWKATMTVTYGFLAQLAWRSCSLLRNRAQWGMCLTFLKDKLTQRLFLPLLPHKYLRVFITYPLTGEYPQHGCDRSPVCPLNEQWWSCLPAAVSLPYSTQLTSCHPLALPRQCGTPLPKRCNCACKKSGCWLTVHNSEYNICFDINALIYLKIIQMNWIFTYTWTIWLDLIG